ncbi:MAG: zinc ABC transporter substrate-binding protein [Hyphomicrobiales bacterium]|nr:MAG: zinc ABC transporter substrate-binding protein [Hyphomicrobiales bacterium]
MSVTLRSRLFASAAAFAAVLAAALPAAALDGVVASIKPVHSLVAAVMEGVGTPALIVRGAGSEHVHSLRPSDAEALEKAGVVFRVGEGMETFLNGPLKTLAAGARVVSLEDAPGLEKLAFREGGPFEAHAHGDGHDRDDGDAHESEGHGHDHDHDHDRDAHDLHIWLDPLNARAMVAEIARVLAEADPGNAMRYLANAQAYSGRIDALAAEIGALVEPVRRRPAVVFHDAYQYFEKRFGVNVVGSITVSPEVMPGAQRLSEIRDKVRELDAACVFSEPQFEPRLVAVVIEGTDARTGVLDPLGAEIPDGPDLYLTLMRNLAGSLAACLSGKG